MELKEIKYILTIASYGSISSAAEALYLSQPSLSQFLKSFEMSLGTRLFYRTQSGIRPTYAGEIFLSAAERIQDIYADAQRDIAGALQTESSGTIRFGLPSSKSGMYLPQILQYFCGKHPNIHVEVTEAKSSQLEYWLLDETIQLALISTPLNHETIRYRIIDSEEIFLATPLSSDILLYARVDEAADRLYIPPEALTGQPFVLPEKGSNLRRAADQFFEANQIVANPLYSVGSSEVAMDLCAKGRGLTLISGSRARTCASLAYLSLGEKGILRDTVMAYSDRAFHSPLCELFIDEVYNLLHGE